MKDTIKRKVLWKVTKYDNDEAYEKGLPFEVKEVKGNLALNEGIGEFLLLLTGGSATAYNNANSRLGVGDSSTAAAATQTDLQAATNKLYKAVDATYPTIADQTVTWRATFESAEANFAWEEYTVDNGASAVKNLNRKVSSLGTKLSGQTWVLDLQITWS